MKSEAGFQRNGVVGAQHPEPGPLQWWHRLSLALREEGCRCSDVRRSPPSNRENRCKLQRRRKFPWQATSHLAGPDIEIGCTSNRHTRRIESPATHSKQEIGAHSNRHKILPLKASDFAGLSAVLALILSLFCALPAIVQSAPQPKIPGDLASDLKEFVETPSVSGYENQLGEKIRAKLAAFHPVVDNLGDVFVTIGTGVPHRLIVTPIDEPGFVVSGITDDGYLRLQRLPQRGNLPLIFNELHSAQPVRIRTAGNQWIDGVVAGESIHLQQN